MDEYISRSVNLVKNVDKKYNFNLSEINNFIINDLLNGKEREVLTRRFGVFDKKPETLESIGLTFGVTRERIRQIEKHIFNKIGSSNNLKPVFKYLNGIINDNGGIMSTLELEKKLNLENSENKYSLRIILESSHDLTRIESPKITESWFNVRIGQNLILSIIKIAEEILKENNKSLTEKYLTGMILKEINPIYRDTVNVDLISSVFSFSKIIGKTPENELGLTDWGIVNPKNTRDKVYVVFKKIKKPLHYKDLTDLIRKSGFSKKNISVEAVHNELIRDPRFVLVGRGIYALKEWGYNPGTIAEVIEDLLKKEQKPMHKNDIIEKVLERRLVKKNTILLNLQEKPQFKRLKRAVYYLREQ